jgi:hypothetical protein
MEKENLAPQIQKLLDELEVLGYDRKRVAEANDYKLKTFSSTLNRGGNKKMLNKIAFYKQTVEQMKQNPEFDILKRMEQIEAAQDVLLIALSDILAQLNPKAGSGTLIYTNYKREIEKRLKDNG